MLLHADYRGVNARQILSVACIHEAAGKSANRAGGRHFFGAVTILTLRWSKCRVIRPIGHYATHPLPERELHSISDDDQPGDSSEPFRLSHALR